MIKDFILSRIKRTPFGVFSALSDEAGLVLFHTIEHSYREQIENVVVWDAKIPNGIYKCVRGKHRLHGMTEDFETFEITGVEGHTGILFHVGNYNKDSNGCVLVGEDISEIEKSGVFMVTNSKESFTRFMQFLQNENEFDLYVVG